jgi:murein endopeptidase
VRAGLLLTAFLLTLLILAAGVRGQHEPPAPTPQYEPVAWHHSRAFGKPFAGRLTHGVRLPPEGEHFVTYDPVLRRVPNRAWRRWATDTLIRRLLRVVRDYRSEWPLAPRVVVGDLSRPLGGEFGPRYGGIGHASHQNGLDVDVYYPRWDGLEKAPQSVDDIDMVLAQDLVDRFVAARAQYVFVGPNTPLKGPPARVQKLVFHDNHMHVRIRNPRRGR